MAIIPKLLVRKRVHDQNTSLSLDALESNRNILHALRASIHRKQKQKSPLVSVVIPVYNAERYLAEAIESILAQSIPPFEVIVIDDGSTDASGQVAKSFGNKVRYYYQENSGLGKALNLGVELGKAEFLAFLDADDLWEEDKLQKQLAAFDDDPQIDMVFGHVRQFLCPQVPKEEMENIYCSANLMPGYICGTLLIRKKTFLCVGAFSTEQKLGDFIDWYLRAHEQGLKGLMLPQAVLKRRLHNQNMGIREKANHIDYVHILRASLKRRRQKEEKVST